MFTHCGEHALRCALFAGKTKFAYFAQAERGAQHYEVHTRAAEVFAAAAGYFRSHEPALMVVHVAEVDAAGHERGWGSAEQISAIQFIDGLLGDFHRQLRDGAVGSLSLIVTADHGGTGLNHGEGRPEDVAIPWIGWGAGFEGPAKLPPSTPASVMDVAPTVLELLGLPLPTDLEGRPRVPHAAGR